jgi:hypothetical protein
MAKFAEFADLKFQLKNQQLRIVQVTTIIAAAGTK